MQFNHFRLGTLKEIKGLCQVRKHGNVGRRSAALKERFT
jgi:hypothetical protein